MSRHEHVIETLIYLWMLRQETLEHDNAQTSSESTDSTPPIIGLA